MPRLLRVAAVLLFALAPACRDATGPTGSAVLIVAGDSQVGLPGDTLEVLVVRVVDDSGGGVAGARVNWLTANGEFLDQDGTSGPDGTARAVVRLGGEPANGAVTASAGPRGEGGSVTFAVEVLDKCDFPVALTIGDTIAGAITEFDCGAIGSGWLLDNYTFTTAATRRVALSMTSTAVDAYLEVRKDSFPVAANDDSALGNLNASVSMLVAAGTWEVWATTFRPGETGAYRLASAAQPTDLEDCAIVWVVGTVTAPQTLPASGCPAVSGGTVVADMVAIVVGSGDTITASATAAGFPARVRIWVNGSVQGSGSAAAAGDTARATFMVPTNAFGTILLEYSSASGGDGGGAYTMTATRRGTGFTAAARRGALHLPHPAEVSRIGRVAPKR